MKVALVHDDLVQWGGAERVLLGLSEIYPDAPIYTSLYDSNNQTLSQLLGSKKIITSFLQKIPGWRNLYKTLLPLYGIAFEQFDFSDFDLIISHTTRFAKSIITKPPTLHICYAHTPPRFLWHLSASSSYGLAEFLLSKLRIYDVVAARRVDHFIAGSRNAQKRIKKIYRREAAVVYPYVDLDRFKGLESFDGGYFVVISRLNQYKRVDLAVKVCLKLGLPLKVIGLSPEFETLLKLDDQKHLVQFLGTVDEQVLASVLSGCKALIIPGVEDFGLTCLEAQALGKAVVAFSEGGVIETVIPGVTGIFFAHQAEDSLKNALLKLDSTKIDPQDCRKNAARFSKDKFIKNFKATVAGIIEAYV